MSYQDVWEWLAGLPTGASPAGSASDDLQQSGQLLEQCRKGDFATVLRSEHAKRRFVPFKKALDAGVSFHGFNGIIEKGENEHLISLLVAVAALQSFAQANWTGPNLSFTSAELLDVHSDKDTASTSSHDQRMSENLHDASIATLQWKGEPAYHLCLEPFLLLFAVRQVDAVLEDLQASRDSELFHLSSWIRLRTALVHNHTLDEPVLIDAPILANVDRARDFLLSQTDKADTARRWKDVLARLILERGLALQQGGQDRDAAELFVEAAKAHGLLYQLSGALGKRTKFQREDKTQLLLLAKSRNDVVEAEENLRQETAAVQKETHGEAKAQEEPSSAKEEDFANSGWQATIKENGDKSMPAEYQLNDDTLLEQTQFTSTASTQGSSDDDLRSIDPSNQPKLSPFDQSILLALSLNIRNTSPNHGLTAEQIGAFVARVLLHPMNWSVYTMALLLRSRLEATRTRTVERSVLQLQALLDQMPTSDSSVTERLRMFFDLDLPAKWEMQAELARRYASIGVTRSALEIFTRIEMWEEVVHCLGSLGRQEEGIEIVRDLLAGKKIEAQENLIRRKEGESAPSEKARVRMDSARQAKYWCLLGDLEPSNALEHYTQAWKVSGESSARAARSLGGVYFAKQEFSSTITWLTRALKINPLFTRSWFILGCAFMREERWSEAATCFQRCTNLDEEDGESWNNLASCYLRMGQDGAKKLVQGNAALESLPSLNGMWSTVGKNAKNAATSSEPGLDLDNLSLAEEDSSSALAETDGGDASTPASSKSDTNFALRKLAHRALSQSLKYARDSWRVWYNYMIVSVDIGELREAARALAKVVELRSVKAANEQEKAAAVDFDVLDRLVSAVTRATVEEEPADAEAGAPPSQQNPNEGKGLLASVERVFTDTLLTRVDSSARIWRAYARLLLWKGAYRACLEAYLHAWKCGGGSPSGEDTRYATEREAFREGVAELRDLVEILENLSSRPAVDTKRLEAVQEKTFAQRYMEEQQKDTAQLASSSANNDDDEEAMPDWKFKARSLVRSYMARTKDSFQDEPEWEELEKLRDELRGS